MGRDHQQPCGQTPTRGATEGLRMLKKCKPSVQSSAAKLLQNNYTTKIYTEIKIFRYQ